MSSKINFKHKASILVLKYIPVLGSFIMLLHVGGLLLGLDLYVAENMFQLSLFPWLICMLWSKAFHFCPLHRYFISYIFLVSSCISFEDQMGFGEYLYFSRVIVFILGIILFGVFIAYLKTHKIHLIKDL